MQVVYYLYLAIDLLTMSGRHQSRSPCPFQTYAVKTLKSTTSAQKPAPKPQIRPSYLVTKRSALLRKNYAPAHLANFTI